MLSVILLMAVMFQSTHPCGVRLCLSPLLVVTRVFQSTHPCGVRPRERRFYNIYGGFNPRTRVGCDRIPHAKNIIRHCFNPRTRVGCDHKNLYKYMILMFQSTHPCGVRPVTDIPASRGTVSIHAPVWGATHRYAPFLVNVLFQSTHPCGVRPSHQRCIRL